MCQFWHYPCECGIGHSALIFHMHILLVYWHISSTGTSAYQWRQLMCIVFILGNIFQIAQQQVVGLGLLLQLASACLMRLESGFECCIIYTLPFLLLDCHYVNCTVYMLRAPCGLRGIMRSWFDFLILVLYILCACFYHMLLHLSFFFTFPYLSLFLLRIDPLHFQARCRKRRLNLALVFCVYFVL